jgi:glucokinase
MKAGLRHAAMVEVNEFLVLDFVRDQERTTRLEIARALGLSASSISRMVTRLLRAGLILESAGSSEAPGRPRARIAFNQRAGCVIGVDLGGTKCQGGLADLSGQVVHEVQRPTHGEAAPYSTLLEVIGELRAEARLRRLPVLAVAVGVPAILDAETGVAVTGPNVQWQDFAIVPRLAADVGVPVIVENDVNLAALAHAWRGDGRRVDDFVTISIGTGIGAAVMANGRVVKGHHNSAGEIGYLTLSADRLRQRMENGVGDFEERASGPGIVRRTAELLATSGEPSELRAVDVTPAAVFGAAADGDTIARIVIEETLDNVALALVAISALLDPERIILDGSVGRSLGPYLSQISDRIRSRLWSEPRLVVSSLGSRATMVGAIVAALQLVHRQSAPGIIFGAFGAGSRGRAPGEDRDPLAPMGSGMRASTGGKVSRYGGSIE